MHLAKIALFFCLMTVGCATPVYYTRPAYAPPMYDDSYYATTPYVAPSYGYYGNYGSYGYGYRPHGYRNYGGYGYRNYNGYGNRTYGSFGQRPMYRQPSTYGRPTPAPRMMYQRRFGR